MRGQRGVTPVVGFVILIGLTAAASMALFVVGASITDGTQSSIETAQAEDSMAQLASSANDLAIGETNAVDFSLNANGDANVVADGDAGNINVTLRLDNDDDVVLVPDRPLGVLTYELDDGTTFAYQGGGVWRQDPDVAPRMVDPPNFEYRAGPRQEPTLTFSLMRIDSGERISDGTGQISVQDRVRHYPTAAVERSNPMGEGTVEIAVESEYCEAWESHFRQRTTGSIVESCDGDQKVVAELIVPERLLDEIEHVAISKDGVEESGGDNNVVGGQSHADDLPSASDAVQTRVEASEGYFKGDVDDTIQGEGRYNYTKIDQGMTIIADDGDIEVVAREGINIDEDISIEGDHEVRFYIGEEGIGDDAEVNIDGAHIGDADNASRTTLYVHSDVDQGSGQGQGQNEVSIGSGGGVTGVVYVPNGDIGVHGEDAFIKGAAIAENIYLRGNPSTLEYDDSLEDKTLEDVVPDDGQRLYFLHVTETEVAVSN